MKPAKSQTQELSKSRASRTSIESLRDYYHSIHDVERAEVIELLGVMEEPEAARELIQLYEECEWRGTRFKIIQALERNPTQRGLEFLFRLARREDDVSIAEAAIRSLGQTHHRLAALFLIHYYPRCTEVLKAAVVGALGQIPDRSLAGAFLTELPKAIQTQQVSLIKNLVVTLGELKVLEAIPLLQEIALQKQIPTNALCALVAIGKISRDVKVLNNLEDRFRDDVFEHQIFSSVKAQIQFRAQWMLEDYLSRIFENEKLHPTLPYELTHFLQTDVKEGLKIFSGARYHDKLCFVLSMIDFPQISTWYQELLDLKNLTPSQREGVFISLSQHQSSTLETPLATLREAEENTSTRWLEASTLCLPEAEGQFRSYFESSVYQALSESSKITALNAINNYALVIQMNPEKLQAVSRILENSLEMETLKSVQARIIRALGSLRVASKKTVNFIKSLLTIMTQGDDLGDSSVSDLIASSLKYLELCPDKSCTTSLIALLDLDARSPLSTKLKISLLRSLTRLPTLPESKKLEGFLRSVLEKYNSEEALTVAALRFLRARPIDSLLNSTINCLKASSRVQLAAIIALKSYPSEEPVEKIAALLNSQFKSLAGRALDTLTGLPGLRAKRIIIDFLKENAADTEICDKILRCFTVPKGQNEYFITTMDDILKLYPQHPLLDGLIALRGQMLSEAVENGRVGFIPKGEDIEIIDRELTSKIMGYADFDESTKSALRSAELPYQHREMFDEYVDKGSSVIEYCKAIDLILEKSLGRKMLFPKLEHGLHEFQNILHAAGLNEDSPSPHYVLKQLELEKHYSAQSLPLYKMSSVAYGIRTGKIVNQQFKILDGLRAWAVMLLLFSRRIQGIKPIISLQNASDGQIVELSKKLMLLQDIRNPVAHRQTVVKFLALDEVRSKVFAVLNAFQKML